MVFGGGPSWTTGCVDNGEMFVLQCNGGQIELRAIYFLTGVCPTGTQGFCSNLGAVGNQLIFASHTCSPFSLTFTLDNTTCPVLASQGDTQYDITFP